MNIAAKLNKYSSIQVNSDLFLTVCPEHIQVDFNDIDDAMLHKIRFHL
jgi:hypothetical protein